MGVCLLESATMRRLLRVLFCHHDYESLQTPDGVTVGLERIGGPLILKKCKKCDRLKWIPLGAGLPNPKAPWFPKSS